MAAIVLDGQLKSSLAIVRSLGKHGVPVYCGAQRESAMALHSRYTRGGFTYTSPKTDSERFVEEVQRFAEQLHEKTGEKPVVFCQSDATSLALARAFHALRDHVLMPLPSLSSLEIASDKDATYACAQKLSIPTIRTFRREAFSKVTYPAVVKNRHSIVWKEGKAITGTAEFVFSFEALQQQFAEITHTTGEEPMVMEFIAGDEYGIEMVCHKGEALSSFAHRRIRSLSPRGGAAVVKETAEEKGVVEMMRTYAAALCRELSWEGPVMVEFKVDARDGRVYLMEINGRFWGSLSLAVASGVDFPLQAYELAKGTPSKPSYGVTPHVRTRHFLGDCKWLWEVFFATDPMRKYLYPSRMRALYDFKKEFFISRGDVFSWDDLLPSVYEYLDILNTWRSKA